MLHFALYAQFVFLAVMGLGVVLYFIGQVFDLGNRDKILRSAILVQIGGIAASALVWTVSITALFLEIWKH